MPTNHVQLRTGSRVVRFDCFEVNTSSGELHKRGIKLRLREQSFQVLAALLERAGEMVTREELRQLLWPGVFVDFDNNLNAVVAHLREVLCDSAERPRFIETLPKRGYRFIASSYEVALSRAAPAPRRMRLLVLPFLNLCGDAGQEYFSDGVTDEIITELALLVPKHLAVIARTTAMHYKGSHKDLGRIAREANVDYVVEGAVRHDAEHVSINVQLIQSEDQAHLFSKRYEAKLGDVFQVQNTIAREITAHIDQPAVLAELRERPASAHLRRKPTESISAYNEYLQGRYLAERLIPGAMFAAKQHFEAAIEADPEFALAHLALADAYSMVGYIGYMRPKDAYSVGLPYALRAVELDDTLAEAHAVLAEYHKQLDYNWPAAEREMARALELCPTSPFVRSRHAEMILMPQNRLKEAIAEIELALESDPLAGATRFWLGIMLLLDRQYDRAIEESLPLLQLEPMLPWPHFTIGIANRQKYFEATHEISERPQEQVLAQYAKTAISEHLKAVELSPGTEYVLGWLGLAYGACGREAEAREVLARLKQSERYNLPTAFAHCHFGMGEIDETFEWLDRAVEERDQVMMPILSYAHFDPLRKDPRFKELLRKMKLERWAE